LDQSLKQRLVGAVVLISLAIIFLPIVFDGQQERINPEEYEFPDQPTITIKALDFEPIEAEAADTVSSLQQVEEAKLAQSAELAETAAVLTNSEDTVEDYIASQRTIDEKIQSQQPKQDVDLAQAWVIQVGAFSSQDNANGLRDKLNQAGFKAYSKPVGALHKVYVGPEIRKYRLQQQKTRLEQEFGLNTLILKYIP
jgi:DedD protein